MPSAANKARRKLFKTPEFRDEAAERLNLDKAMVFNAIAALLAAGSIPCARADNAEALAVDGARLLIAIGSQVRPDAIARVTARFAEMTLQIDADRPNGATAGMPPQELASFETDLAAMFRNSWTAARSVMPSPIDARGVSLLWHDPRGSILFGTIDRWERGKPRKKKIYASEPLRLPSPPGGGEWDFVHLLDSFRLPAVGGTIFSPLPLLGFCELLAEGVEDTAAGLQ